MQLNDPSRLDRIEALLERTAQIALSNSRSIQALADDRTEDRLRHEEFMARTEERLNRMDLLIERVNQTNEGVVNLLARQEETQPTLLSKLTRIEGKIDRLLEQRDGEP